MLGRQQIAGIPTAISEIFKNAYDAYATQVRGDFYPDQGILSIRDNGVGMSLEDFMTRWLTIGTESKAADSSLPKVRRPSRMTERRQMGEKGIGRLAIATVGPQLVVVTRGTDHDGASLDSLVVSLIQWSMFEIPGITLEDVMIPVREIRDSAEIGSDLLQSMSAEVSAALDKLGERVPKSHAARIRQELALLDFDLSVYLRVNGPKVIDGSGTAFVVCPVSPDVSAAMQVRDPKPDEFSVSDFQRFLLGFTNSITPSSKNPDFATTFIRHDHGGATDLIDEASYFWEDDDFALTDHTIEGEFDEFGSFKGEVNIYRQQPAELVQEWREGGGRPTACGPFKIKFGYVQGKASESSLEGTDFATMTARLEKIGGLYVYRDGIRVLPYGNADYDYLEIEKRRTLNAATYYFSYRRMFGAIELDSSKNKALQEKAGREGFRENAAYRDFREVLKSFLVQLAANYFSSKSEPSEEWRTRRQALSVESKRRREEDTARLELEKKLGAASSFIESGALAKEIQKVVSLISGEINKSNVGSLVSDRAAIEARAARQLVSLFERVDVVRPAKLPLTTDLEREWNSYRKLRSAAESMRAEASSSLESAFESLDADSAGDPSLARNARLDRLVGEMRTAQAALEREVVAKAESVGGGIVDSARKELTDFEVEVDALMVSRAGGFAEEQSLMGAVQQAADAHQSNLQDLLLRLEAVTESGNLLQQVTRLQERILDLEEQVDDNLELLQLGQAVQIISHEFDNSIRSVRAGLKQLEPWARSTPRLQPLVNTLRAAFAHLDGYLRLFTPLQRRLYKEEALISGADIESFLRGVFDERLVRHQISLEVTPEFREYSFLGYPSTFYPVFVNLVDNAIHWLAGQESDRTITLRVDGLALVVADSGPGVRAGDADYIFERGFSRRRGGRGLGLSLARELLARDSWALTLEPAAAGAEFQVSPIEVNEEEVL